jgi:hypothetical protein
MAVGTRKTNANTHPGLVILEGKRQRRTRKQIEEDEAHKTAEATTARLDAEALHNATVARITQLENSMEQDEELVREHANRPDLVTSDYENAKKPVAASKCQRFHCLTATSNNLPATDATNEGETEGNSGPDSEGGGGGYYSPPQSTIANESADDWDKELEDDDPMDHGSGSYVGASHSGRTSNLKGKVPCDLWPCCIK